MKTIAITGATSGIGLETAKFLHHQGHPLLLIVRNTDKALNLVTEWAGKAPVEIVECDLASLESVKQAADHILSKNIQLDVLINNAGGVFQQREISKDGFEMHFAMNHLGHFLLTERLMPIMKNPSRIINVSSEAHRAGKLNFADLQMEKNYSAIKGYANGKLCNIYFTQSLHERYAERGISTFSLHPGVVKTGFAQNNPGFIKTLFSLMSPFMISAEKGAATTIYLATEPGIEKYSGYYFKNKKPTKSATIAFLKSAQQQLWIESEKLVLNFR